jgi:glycosyltransferase involved in cell wall biosynthesis
MEELADFANDYMDVAGWISLFPSFNLVTRLHKPVAVIFPDAIPKIFHEFSDLAWGYNGNHAVWEGYVREVVTKADRLITFSEHVRDGQLGPLFGVSADKVRVVPHAPPDLAGSLPFKEPSRRTRASLGLAAELLREHAAERGWEYLRNFPFDQVPYMAVSTQDRVTKNIRLILDAVLRLVRQQRVDLKILSTSPLHFGADWTVLPGAIERAQAHRDLVSVPDLPKEQHAALFHCAAVAIHASIFEGGHAPFPFYEALSVGTPCLMARGPHVEELLAEEPGLAEFVFDPNDAGGLGALIVKTIDARERSFAVQYEIYQRLRKRTWTDVAVAYAEAATAHLQ